MTDPLIIFSGSILIACLAVVCWWAGWGDSETGN